MKRLAIVLAISTLSTLLIGFAAPGGKAFADGGFDQFGYNYQARIFVGAADGVDLVLDGAVYENPALANDHLVMKWSQAWDDAWYHSGAWTPNAWMDQEWNGQVPGGSGYSEHYKMIWVGPEGADSPYWREGGYLAPPEFEVIFDQGMGPDNVHQWYAHVMPSGQGR